jgi:hypothetical protein
MLHLSQRSATTDQTVFPRIVVHESKFKIGYTDIFQISYYLSIDPT